MKKILTALVIVGLTYTGANAQLAQGLCRTSSDKVCRYSSDKKMKSCYPTPYAQNFKVCNDEHGYYICCEQPGYNNSTNPYPRTKTQNPDVSSTANYENKYASNEAGTTNPIPPELIAPQSQSYPANTDWGINNASSYEGYYPEKGHIKVCYGGDNVAEDNRMPYQGCPSPQYDGPDKNNARNINESTPMNMPPLTGTRKGE